MNDIPDWLRPTVYRTDFNEYPTIEERGPGLYAVCDCGTVWNFRTGKFVVEPLPSSRSGPFKTNTRRSLADCIAVVEGMRPKS